VWTLHPRTGKVGRKIGRSTGKAFVLDGISLSEDSEVSTTHGKVSVHHVCAPCVCIVVHHECACVCVLLATCSLRKGPAFVCVSLARPPSPQIDILDGRCQYTDMGSTNGSMLNGVDLPSNVPTVLSTGDLLKVGSTCMKVKLVRV
jgi:hypothetical protein